MALLQRSQIMRSCSIQTNQTKLRPVVSFASRTHMRRLSAPGLANQSPNQLSTGILPPMGIGQTYPGCGQQARQKIIVRSFLGVGAPEALLVAVVALVVFGPKGLADAAKSLGQTLRAFQPTIREVVEVSNEIKGTLEQELGLDEIRSAASLRPTSRPVRTDSSSSGSDTPSTSTSSSSTLQPISEDQAKQLDPDIELKRAMSEQAAWSGQAPAAVPVSTAAARAAVAAPGEGQAAGAAQPAKDLSSLSMEELEAELARRKKSA